MRKYEHLGTPFKIGKLTLKNRFCMAPIGGGQHHLPGGGLKNETIQYLAERAKGGFALIFTGAMAADETVDPYNTRSSVILRNPDAFKITANELNERAGAYGRKNFSRRLRWDWGALSRAACAVASPRLPSPGRAVAGADFGQIKIQDRICSEGGEDCERCGEFAGVEVHSIHWGYLLDQFALSMMNHRTDEYGRKPREPSARGERNRRRHKEPSAARTSPSVSALGLKTFIKDIEKATLTGEEEAGRTLEEGIEIAKLLETYGYDCLNVDTGTYDSFYYACPPMYMPKGYAVELAAKAKTAVKIPILAGGRNERPRHCRRGAAQRKDRRRRLGRAALADPEYPNKVISGHPERIRPCIACNQAA